MMSDEQITKYQSMNECIEYCFNFISNEDQKKFLKGFRNYYQNITQTKHIFRELLLGTYLNTNQLYARYEWQISAKTPDWCVIDANAAVSLIVELTNFGIDYTTNRYIEESLATKGRVAYWRDGNTDNKKRLYQTIQSKAQKYKDIAQKNEIPNVVALFSSCEVGVDINEIRYCLKNEENGLFNRYPSLSGLIFFEEYNGIYKFIYESNTKASNGILLPNCNLTLTKVGRL